MTGKMYRGFDSVFLFISCVLSLFVLICGEEEKYPILEPSDVPIIVLSQSNIYHVKRANLFKQLLVNQTREDSEITYVDVHFLHERWYHPGRWTILSILPDLVRQFADRAGVFFCEEETRIDLHKLYYGFSKFDFTKELFLGRGLRDKEATIIHHFAFHESPSSFLYPHFAAGFVLSMPLIQKLAARLKENPPKSDFSIDAQHELAMYIWNNGEGLRMKEANFICSKPGVECATEHTLIFPDCGDPVSEDRVLFAVKTCEQFHKDRVPVVKDTWGGDVKHIEFYSDKYDDSIPTIDLGIPNTERGHCGKTMAIIKRFREEEQFRKMKWLVITDDDTLLRVPRLYQLLACYNPEEPIAYGERYGYGLSDGSGYNYITGGGGMVFSHQAVKMLIDYDKCHCGSNDAPDDMILGMCLKSLDIPITHSRYLHQARPMDYAADILFHHVPVSFHKHWMVDPRYIYRQYLDETTHDEL